MIIVVCNLHSRTHVDVCFEVKTYSYGLYGLQIDGEQ